MVKRKEAEWCKLFEAHYASELSVAAFCKENKLCPEYFSSRSKQLLGETAKKVSPAFVKIQRPKQVVSMTGDVKVKIGAVELHVTKVSPEFIAAMIKQLT